MKKTIRLAFATVLMVALVLSSFIFANAVSVGTESEFVSALSDGASEINITADFTLATAVAVNESVKINGGTHTITVTAPNGGEIFTIGGSGTYEFNGGIWDASTTGSNFIYTNDSTFRDGTIKVTGGAYIKTNERIIFTNNATGQFIFDDATIENTASSQPAFQNRGPMNVQLLGGTVTLSGSKSIIDTSGSSSGAYTFGKPDGTGPILTITNTSNTNSLIYLNAGVDTLTHTFYGGTYEHKGTGKTFNMGKAATVKIEGGAFKSNSGPVLNLVANAEVKISGGTFTTTSGNLLYVPATAFVDIKAGTFNNGTATAISNSGTVQITGGTFNFDPAEFVDTSKSTVTENTGVWTVVTADDGSGGDNSDGQVDADGYVNVLTADAFKKAIADKKSKIKVIADFALTGGAVTINFPVIINGNNKTITGAGFSFSGDNVIEINNLNFVGSGTRTDIYKTSGDVKLTFSGGSVSGNGTGSGDEVLWVQSSTTSGAVITLTNGFRIDSTGGSNMCVNISSGAAGKFIIDNADLISATRVVRCQAAVELKVLSGTLTSNGKLNVLDLIGSSNSLTVGKLDGTGPVLYNLPDPDASALINLNGATGDNYVIYGGTFYAGAFAELSQAIAVKDGIELAILGGTFNVDPSNYVDASKYQVTNNGILWTVAAPVYEITFNANGGNCATASKNTNVYFKLDSLPEVTRENYLFVGWYTAAEGGEKVTTNTVFTSNTTIYARWTNDCDHKESTVQPDCKNSVVCSICGKDIPPVDNHIPVWKYDANQHWQECELCHDVIGTKENHYGGSGDCNTQKVCAEANCAQHYGANDFSNHLKPNGPYTYKDNNDGKTHVKIYTCCNTIAVANEAHSFDADGVCVCNSLKTYDFKNASDKNQIIGVGQEITFTSVADFAKFVGVKVNSVTLTKDVDYVAVSGSTKVTLKADFVKTLTVGSHKIEIISTDGTATTNFGIEIADSGDVNAPSGDSTTPGTNTGTTTPNGGSNAGTTTPDAGTTIPDAGTTTPDAGTTTPDAGTTTPNAGTTTPNAGANDSTNVGTSDKTGDISNFALLFALVAISGLGAFAAVIFGKKKSVK